MKRRSGVMVATGVHDFATPPFIIQKKRLYNTSGSSFYVTQKKKFKNKTNVCRSGEGWHRVSFTAGLQVTRC